MKWIICMRQSWAMPPDEDAVWDGKDWAASCKHAKFYDSKEDADAALVGVALKFPPEEKAGYYSRTLNVMAVTAKQQKIWETTSDEDD